MDKINEVHAERDQQQQPNKKKITQHQQQCEKKIFGIAIVEICAYCELCESVVCVCELFSLL